MVFVLKPNQNRNAALWRERSRKFNPNKRKLAKYRNVQLELICGFAETYFTKMYCGDWVEQKKYLLEDLVKTYIKKKQLFAQIEQSASGTLIKV